MLDFVYLIPYIYTTNVAEYFKLNKEFVYIKIVKSIKCLK